MPSPPQNLYLIAYLNPEGHYLLHTDKTWTSRRFAQEFLDKLAPVQEPIILELVPGQFTQIFGTTFAIGLKL